MHLSNTNVAIPPIVTPPARRFSDAALRPAAGTVPVPRRLSAAAEGALVTAALSVFALLIHGYHPYAEDGGLYVSAILKSLVPSLYPAWGQFVTVQWHYSLFAALVAKLIQLSRLRVSVAIFALHMVSIWATLFAGWLIAARCYASRQARYGAVSLLASLLTIPIAGTSLLLMDPYLTARSISTPCGLFALAATLDIAAAFRNRCPLPRGSAAACFASILLAGIVHPLMAGFIVCCLALLFASATQSSRARVAWTLSLCLVGLGMAAALAWFGPLATPNYFRAEHTRDYWFLHNWHWYEIVGLIAPPLVLAFLTRRTVLRGREASRWIARMAVAGGFSAIAIALLFAGSASLSYEVARMQPLRIFHAIYIVMILILGAALGERLLARRLWRWAAMLLVLGTLMFYVQRRTFPASGQLELPWSDAHNGWEEAFLWARENTPRDALFALDANYITYPGEDAQYFRAVARRSALADASKDGGLAAIDPQLADAWMLAQTAQTGLATESDAQRLEKVRPFGVSWMVLPADSATQFACPYRNAAAKVCMLPLIRR